MSQAQKRRAEPDPSPPPTRRGSDVGEGLAQLGEKISQLGERVARVEASMQYLSTKEDLQKVKVWVLGGVIVGSVSAVVVIVGLARIAEGWFG